MVSIDEIMKLLRWDNSPQQQHQGIQYANSIQCIKCFFQPQGEFAGKPVWENCAVVICSKSDDALTPYFLDMLLWIQDLNWPGAEMILSRLIKLEKVEQLAVLLDKMIPALSFSDDNGWLFSISQLLQNAALADKLSVTGTNILRQISLSQSE